MEVKEPPGEQAPRAHRAEMRMKHRRLDEWTDFVRGVAEPGRQAAMQRHLETGCNECRRTVEYVRTVVQVAAKEASYSPQSSAVRIVKSYFAVHAPKQARTLAGRIAELIWDSFLEPLPAGVRSLSASPRQQLYQAGDYMIDMRMQEIPGTGRLWVVGQIQHSGQPSNRPAEIPMTIENDERLLAATKTNAYGEFHMEFENRPKVSLFVPLEKIGVVQIPVGSGSAEGRWKSK